MKLFGEFCKLTLWIVGVELGVMWICCRSICSVMDKLLFFILFVGHQFLCLKGEI